MNVEHSARHYSIDQDRMIDKVLSLPDQMDEAWGSSLDFVRDIPEPPSSFIISAMGGSAIGGQLMKDLIRPGCRKSLHIERGYSLPSFAGTDTPVICISYSGNTEEVISAFREAIVKGSPVAVITSGGLLADEAEAAGVPLLKIPGGNPPRASLGYLFAPLVRLASEWNILDIDDEAFDSVMQGTRSLLEKCHLEADLAGNSAMQLAKRLYGKTPLIYSGDGLLAGAAYRWKCQFNENSKSMAFFNTFPELGHNEIMAWDCPEKLRQYLFLIMLCDRDDDPRVTKRMEAAYLLLESLAGGAIKIESSGAAGAVGRFERQLSAVVLGDLTSVYLAVEYGVDPTPIKKIDELKDLTRSEYR
ncbi:MAG: bifunctional phosphoglucose/phosphomannose isomerase [Candidatus Krumholzibacteriota bacterium]|nr:bifunctional phosphoglucose/phosphomannose isomerase [Candidatus Krumholzibacteriota bacterium]